MRQTFANVGGVATAVIVALLLSGCGAVDPRPSPTDTPTASATPTPTPTPTADPLATLSLAQKVGQVFMVGTTATAAEQATLDAVTSRDVGGIFLSGRSQLGVATTASVVAQFTAQAATAQAGLPASSRIPLLVATDQEGGQVQVLNGSGFSSMPSGLEQGEMTPADLRSAAQLWGSELANAGVNMNLAPVVDQVGSAQSAQHNPPIGRYQREFGYDVPTITSHASAFRTGMTASHVVTVLKHFPGLGFVSANTDTTSGVTDTVTGPDGPNVGIYRNQIAAGANCIMVSSAIYSRIDASAPAVFSATVVTGLLRENLGFRGLIVSDDLSGASQVTAWTPAERAILAIQAGVDLVLVSRTPGVAAEMIDAVLTKAQADPTFAAQVDAAARHVIALKATLGHAG